MMDFGLSDEQSGINDVVAQYLAGLPEMVKNPNDPPELDHAGAEWVSMAERLGLPGLVVPEDLGGVGLGFVELALVMEEMGKVLHSSPFLCTAALAAPLLARCGDAEMQHVLLPGILDGSLTAAVSLAAVRETLEGSRSAVTASPVDGAWRLQGVDEHVPDGMTADLLLVVASTSAGTGLFTIQGDAPGVRRSAVHTLDQSRPQASLVLDGVMARLVGQVEPDHRTLDFLIDVVALVIAAEQVGMAQRSLDEAVEYARTRTQFGRPIGALQVIKHMCADLTIQVEAARVAVHHAGWAMTESIDASSASVSMAKAYAGRVCVEAAEVNIQIHGGIGFTWEHSAHRYFKRARSSEVLFGTETQHRERALAHLEALGA
jgi:alkylation response protein AidB-like acyl-CoA dehydrogenase